MEEIYRVDYPPPAGSSSSSNNIATACSNEFGSPTTAAVNTTHEAYHHFHFINTTPPHNHQDIMNESIILSHNSHNDFSHIIKTQIANHPLYPNLLSAYIDCQKVGAPPEMASLLEEINKERLPMITPSIDIGSDPELDQFMESYCGILQRYKKELSKPFDEATAFLNTIESQLSNLCKGSLTISIDSCSDELNRYGEGMEEAIGRERQEEEWKGGEGDEEELKGMLLRKYSGYLSSLKKEFLKKRKQGKLPNDAKVTLLDWWNDHYRWPYPTEDEKLKLSEMTGLDPKQINNWFINQRKRHWKPSEDMRFALFGGLTTPLNFGEGSVCLESDEHVDVNIKT